MLIYPTSVEINPKSSFPTDDPLGNHELANGLTKLVLASSQPLVIALDGSWGSGKSTFLMRLESHLHHLDQNAIRFDAFEHDYMDDAFLALSSCIYAMSPSKSSGDKLQNFKKRAVDVSKVIARSGAKMLVQVATQGLVTGSKLDEFASEIGSEAGDQFDKYIGERITDYKQQKDAILAFKAALSALSEDKPLILIIDELDRCRPDYALELLEKVKHFFSVPNVHFILGLDFSQLGNMVKSRYGSELDVQKYLQKFIHLIAHLNTYSGKYNPDHISIYINQLSKQYKLTRKDQEHFSSMTEFLKAYSLQKSLTYRDIERIYSACYLATISQPENFFKLGVLVAGLVILKLYYTSVFSKIKKNNFSYQEISTCLGLDTDPPEGKTDHSWLWRRDIWKLFSPECPEEILKNYSSMRASYSLAREDTLQWMALNLVDSMSISDGYIDTIEKLEN